MGKLLGIVDDQVKPTELWESKVWIKLDLFDHLFSVYSL